MIRFEAIRVVNFALYPDVTLPFSINAQQPLTLLRGENESGKTTLMRAFVWALFGSNSLPRVPDTRHPVRPVWAKAGEKVRTRVEVRFRSESDRGTAFFRLSRSVNTSDDGSLVASDGEAVNLYRRDGDDWVEQDDQLQILLKRFFRPEMRDFYFIDADKAVEFVGGPEGRHSDQVMREATTQSIRALLGLDVMLKARERLEDRHLNWSRQAGSQSSNAEQQRLAAELNDVQAKLEDAKTRLSELVVEEKDREDSYRAVERDFEDRISKLEEINETNAQYDAVTRDLAAARSRQNELVNELVQRIDDERFFSAMMLPAIEQVINVLQSLKDKGYIPPTELTLLPRLLERGECVCGVNLRENPKHRKHIEAQIQNAQQSRGRSYFLDSALESARSFGNRAIGRSDPSWLEDTETTANELAQLDPGISKLTEKQDALREVREKAGSGAAIKELKKHRDDLRSQLDIARDRRQATAAEVDDLQRSARSLSERIRTAATAEKRTQVARACADVADDLRKIIADAYDSIERDQVADVSTAMNSIFRDVITATSESLFGEVGIRAVAANHTGAKQYELYALEGGREKPLALANGASRRAIGVSFVLALAQETQTKVPLVADSLLHAMSGAVKQKIIEYLTTGDRVGQPILFGTRTDFLDPEVSSILKQRAGKSYTLTSQTHAGGDVVRATSGKCPKQVVVCTCAVDEFCPVCERTGDESRAQSGRLRAKAQAEIVE